MDKKNTMLLTVIAVATLLVAVVGATFAYFAIGATAENNAKTTITGSTENAQVGTVALTGNNDINMALTAEDMSLANKGHTFYAKGDGTAVIDSEQKLTIGTATLTGGSSGVVYKCIAKYTITYDDTDLGAITWSDGTSDQEALGDDGAVLKLSAKDGSTIDIPADLQTIKLKDLASNKTKSGNITFTITGNGSSVTSELQASLAIANSEKEQQGRLANKKFTITFETDEEDGFTCDTVSAGD